MDWMETTSPASTGSLKCMDNRKEKKEVLSSRLKANAKTIAIMEAIPSYYSLKSMPILEDLSCHRILLAVEAPPSVNSRLSLYG